MRAVFEMHFIEGMPVREIAVKLGITSKTVSNHRHNVLVALRTKFANDADALVLIWLFARSATGEI
jgi:DNA-directed RNA polymerase specialized sigma24 family protein